jgi:hypothetical protein
MFTNRIAGAAASLAGAVFLAGAAHTGALADANLNCGAYAGVAVADNEQNKNLGCGFSGAAWSSDFNAHFSWCQQPATKMANLTAEDKARKAALAQCAQKPAQTQQACQGYADQAVKQSKEAAAMRCGFAGGRWAADYATHFNWCLTANEGARTAEVKARTDQLFGCLSSVAAKRQEACNTYAAIAVVQAQSNAKRQCGFTGGRWSADKAGHMQWCMSAGPEAAAKEQAIRVAALKNECLMEVCTTTRTTNWDLSVTTKKTCKLVPRPE